MSSDDQTKELLEELLANLYSKQAARVNKEGDSYLIAQDDQYLGKITDNQVDRNSILNEFGPFGSKFSITSIFNMYSMYGSPYGQFSIINPYCSSPPKLFLNGQFRGLVTKNQYLTNTIPTDGFLYTLKNNISALLSGNLIRNAIEARQLSGDSFIEASDGTYLGSLKPNKYNQDSIFNSYGPYGNKYSQTSIFNRYGPYGGMYSQLSPFNPYASNPPKIYHNGQVIGYLTVNSTIQSRIDPNNILDWASQNVLMN